MIDAKVIFGVLGGKPYDTFDPDICCSNVGKTSFSPLRLVCGLHKLKQRYAHLTGWWRAWFDHYKSQSLFQSVSSGGFNEVFKLVLDTQSAFNLLPLRKAYKPELHETATQVAVRLTKILDSRNKLCNFSFDEFVSEIMLFCLAASKGFGPTVYAAYVIPSCESIVPTRNFQSNTTNCPHAMHKVTVPQPGWLCEESGKPVTDAKHACTQVIVMEYFASTLDYVVFRSTSDEYELIVQRIFRLCEQLSKTYILHCDLKANNVVCNTTKNGHDFDMRAIDFDPKFCKTLPSIPENFLAILNASLLLAQVKCALENKKIEEEKRKAAADKQDVDYYQVQDRVTLLENQLAQLKALAKLNLITRLKQINVKDDDNDLKRLLSSTPGDAFASGRVPSKLDDAFYVNTLYGEDNISETMTALSAFVYQYLVCRVFLPSLICTSGLTRLLQNR